MTQPHDDDSTGSTEQTFTRAQVRSMIAAEVRKVREQFADYDDLKAQAAEAAKNKSAIERIEAKLNEQTARAEKAERDSLIREVADQLGMPMRLARKLEGKTREELLADGRETMDELGLKSTKGKGKTSTKGKGKTDEDDDRDDDEQDTDEDDDRDDEDDEPRSTRRRQADDEQPSNRRERPRESLRSGAPATRPSGPDLSDPLKLIEGVRRA